MTQRLVVVHRCRQCDQRKETRLVMRFGGGTYKRAGYWRRAMICKPCATELWHSTPEGQLQTHRWSVRGLRTAWNIQEES